MFESDFAPVDVHGAEIDSTGHVEVMRERWPRRAGGCHFYSGVDLDARVERCGPLITFAHGV